MKSKNTRMCNVCKEKKATVRNPNGQWCCRKCNGRVTMMNHAMGRILTRNPELAKVISKNQ